MLPFKPQTLEQLQGRYPAALRKIFDCTTGVPRPRPGELYSQVFDCEDGIRLIVSRDKESESDTFLHVSASFVEGTFVWNALKGSGDAGQKKFIEMVEERFSVISGDNQRLTFHGFSVGKQVPHWRRLEKVNNEAS